MFKDSQYFYLRSRIEQTRFQKSYKHAVDKNYEQTLARWVSHAHLIATFCSLFSFKTIQRDEQNSLSRSVEESVEFNIFASDNVWSCNRCVDDINFYRLYVCFSVRCVTTEWAFEEKNKIESKLKLKLHHFDNSEDNSFCRLLRRLNVVIVSLIVSQTFFSWITQKENTRRRITSWEEDRFPKIKSIFLLWKFEKISLNVS